MMEEKGQRFETRAIRGQMERTVYREHSDSRTIATHPAFTTHSRLTEEERQAVGIRPGMVRISAGLEHIDDVIADVEQALG